MNIELRKIPPSDKRLLASMLDTYLIEHYQHKETQAEPRSTSEYIYFEDYWREYGRFPYFIVVDGEIAGFVLVRTVFEENSSFFQVSEYYIATEFRRQRIGSMAVRALWALHPGRWEFQVLRENHSALAFWTKCCEQFAMNGPKIREVSEEDGARIQFNIEVPRFS